MALHLLSQDEAISIEADDVFSLISQYLAVVGMTTRPPPD
jgi:hypothetical protein